MAQHANQTSGQAPKPKHRIRKLLLRFLGTILVLVLLAAAGLVVFLTVTEYKPAATEKLTASGGAGRTMTTSEEFTVLTWNIGYGALGDNADFFMDGGKGVLTASAERVKQNISDVNTEIARINPDILLLQEVDYNSKRSTYLNQTEAIHDENPHMASYFARNYRTAFVPFGIPPYGKVESGVQTLTTFKADEATRVSLSNSYTWPLSPVQLKRCELVLRIPVEGSNHELVLINEHPDAYTDEEHHAAQMNQIRELMEAEAAKGNWVIAGGDWNHSFSNIDLSKYPILKEGNWEPGYLNTNDFTEGWQFLMDASAPTSRLLDHPMVNADGTSSKKELQLYMIDGFIASSNVKVLSVETQDLNFKASDHNPVVMKVLLEKD